PRRRRPTAARRSRFLPALPIVPWSRARKPRGWGVGAMRRRRFLLAAASAAAAAPFVGIAGCGNGSSGGDPEPVPPSDVVLHLPEDMYRHPGAPTEWWWHTGTLRAGERTFGFEINAASFIDRGLAFSQILLTDVQTSRVFQRSTFF